MLKNKFTKVFLAALMFSLLLVINNSVSAESYTVKQTELDNKLKEIYSQTTETENGHYKVSNIDIVDVEENQKEVKDTKQLYNLTTNNKEVLKEKFDKTIKYSDKDYEGKLTLDDIEVSGTAASFKEEIIKHDIEFKDYSSNDLNEIKKTILVNDKTYYLIKVDWEIDKTEIIDGEQVATSYKGVAHYESIKRTEIPASYVATATYKGTVTKINKDFLVNVDYEFVEKKDNTPIIIGTVVISGLGLSVILSLVFTRNVKVYNIIESKEKLVAMYRLSKSKMFLDLSKVKMKGSNIYKIKFKKSLFEKIKNQSLSIKDSKGLVKKFTVANSEFTINL